MNILDEMRKGLESVRITKYCNFAVVNALLALKAEKAEQLGIMSDIQIETLTHISAKESELCSIFSNLYDNAIEACKNLPAEKKQIKIRAGIRNNCLLVRFENPYIGVVKRDLTGRILTSKPDHRNHGLGLKLINDIIKQYNGDMVIKTDDSLFTVTISLPVEK